PGATAGSAGEPGHRSDDRRRRPERATRLDRAGRAPGRGPATRRPAGTAELSLGSAPGAHRLPAGERPLVRRRLAGHRYPGLRSFATGRGCRAGVVFTTEPRRHRASGEEGESGRKEAWKPSVAGIALSVLLLSILRFLSVSPWLRGEELPVRSSRYGTR